jgi:murein DD-endopeptidase MepM/ murein hydrolase activator NlpD
VLDRQNDRLADQAARLQTQDEQITRIADDLGDLKSRMANLDRHNAQLREVLGIDTTFAPTEAQGGEPPAATPTLTPTPPGPSSRQEPDQDLFHNFSARSSLGRPGAAAPPMGGDDAPPSAETTDLRGPDEINRLLENFRQDVIVLREELTEREAAMGELDTRTAQRVAEWATAVDEQPAGPDSPEIAAALAEVQAQIEAPAIQPPAAPQPKPKPPPVARSSIPSGLPYYGYISSPFGWRDSPFNPGTRTYHKGMDIVAPTGTSVRATQAGTVIVAGWTDGYGRTVMIDHGKGWVTIYGHNSRVKVEVGQWVDKGQSIALSGNTGPSTGPHIHYEIRYKGSPVNPAKYR